MHNKDKYPEIWASFERLKERKDQIIAKRKVFTDQMNELFVEMESLCSPLRERIQILSHSAYEDQQELFAVSKEISTLAKAMGANTIKAPLS